MENLNAEQVKKALECCSLLYEDRDCTVCPKSSSKVCTVEVMRESLSLITAKGQRIKELTEDNDKLYRLVDGKIQENKKLTEENERLRAENSTLMADRLVANTEVIVRKMKLEALDHRYNRVKSDTVSEIRARVAVHFGTYTDKDQVKIADVFKLIDQIAKEMLEGENER